LITSYILLSLYEYNVIYYPSYNSIRPFKKLPKARFRRKWVGIYLIDGFGCGHSILRDRHAGKGHLR